jgi:hypothetical protein
MSVKPIVTGLVGPLSRVFAEPHPGPDPKSFRTDNTSSAYYDSAYFKAHKSQVQPIPAPRKGAMMNLNLADYAPPQVMAAIDTAKQITFHSTGDTGAAKVSKSQSPATAIGHESAVADAMAQAVASGGVGGPAFFFHLGDVIYNFGEAQYYYDQFYDPYRAYDRPIFAIPGNHDGMVFGNGSSAPQVPTLEAFLTNFCAVTPSPSPDGGGLMRSVMTQPGVYFTLDAPYISIIGLYSNVLDGPGVISSQGGHFPLVDDQLDFLKSELTRLKPDRVAGNRAVIIAVHHPPLSADAKHGGSSGVQKDLDTCCKAAGLWPDMVLSGHAHLYQRFTRVSPDGKHAPYIIAGCGGFAATAPREKLPPAPITSGDHTMEIDPIVNFGYLTITTDAKTLAVTFHTATTADGVALRDSVTVNLKTGQLVTGAQTGTGVSSSDAAPAAGHKRTKKVSKKKRG